MKIFKERGGTKEILQKIKAAAPKKCLSAYMIFVRETRKRIQDENPDMPALEIMKEVGREWQMLDDEGRQRFQVKADADKHRFRKEKSSFESKMKRLMQNPDPTILDSPGLQMRPKKRRRSIKKIRKFEQEQQEQRAPKRSLSSFIFFSQIA